MSGLADRPLATFVTWEAVTTLGQSAMETALLLRAGLSNVALSEFIDGDGERIRMCGAPALPSHLRATQRIVALAELALARLAESTAITTRSVLVLALSDRYATADQTSELNQEGCSLVAPMRATCS